MRWQLWLGALLLFGGLADTSTHAQLTEEQKRQLFLKAREQMRTVPTPTPSATPRPKPKPAKQDVEKGTAEKKTIEAKTTPEKPEADKVKKTGGM